MKEATGEKKPAQGGLIDRWIRWRLLRAIGRKQQRREKVLAERGDWGYIPPGCVLMSKRSFRIIIACLWVMLVTNAIILAGQWPTVWGGYFVSQSHTTGAAAMAPPTAATSPTK